MRFAHFADVHIGAWREPRLHTKSTDAFLQAVTLCKEKKVDFIIISGDLFDTALPSINLLKEVVIAFRNLQQADIPIYLIPGSHDFSPSGKTMIDVLESAGLCINVMRGTIENNTLFLRYVQDPKTGAKLTGIIGKKGMLDKVYYTLLDKQQLEQESGTKIFLFHTAIAEFRPKSLEKMDAVQLSYFPRGLAYYAGGHVHQPLLQSLPHYNSVAMPGPLFPVNFRELEKLQHGGFYIVDITHEQAVTEFIPIVLHPTISFCFDAEGKTPQQVATDAIAEIKQHTMQHAIVTLRFVGCLSTGRAASVDFEAIFQQCYAQKAFIVLKNTAKLLSESFSEKTYALEDIARIEEKVIDEHIGQSQTFSREEEKQLTTLLLQTLNLEKEEGETAATFESRLLSEIEHTLKIKL